MCEGANTLCCFFFPWACFCCGWERAHTARCANTRRYVPFVRQRGDQGHPGDRKDVGVKLECNAMYGDGQDTRQAASAHRGTPNKRRRSRMPASRRCFALGTAVHVASIPYFHTSMGSLRSVFFRRDRFWIRQSLRFFCPRMLNRHLGSNLHLVLGVSKGFQCGVWFPRN